MEGLFFLCGLAGIVWLAYWTTQEGREIGQSRAIWSPFDWRDGPQPQILPPDRPSANSGGWRRRAGRSAPRATPTARDR